MEWTEYLELSEKTLSHEFHATDPQTQRVLHGVIGVCTEVGELIEAFEGGDIDIDVVNLKEELGDAFWYLAILERENPMGEDTESDDTIQSLSGNELRTLLVIESANLLDRIKKKLFYGKPLDDSFNGIVKKIQDCLIALATKHDLNAADIFETNINKLKARYGDKFSADKATNRDLETEREVLEEKPTETDDSFKMEDEPQNDEADQGPTAEEDSKGGSGTREEAPGADRIPGGMGVISGTIILGDEKVGIDYSEFQIQTEGSSITQGEIAFRDRLCWMKSFDEETKIATLQLTNNKAEDWICYLSDEQGSAKSEEE